MIRKNLIAIGASTGGTEAILSVVKHFPKETPGVVITQHMPAKFTTMYAERLNSLCPMTVREAKHGDHVQQGVILVAPGGYQMRVVRMGTEYVVSVRDEGRVNGLAPSVDVLFDSVARASGPRAVGVILTGMGADGAQGLLHMKESGSYSIGQNKETCVVYGMPMEAKKIGALCAEGNLEEIPGMILQQFGLKPV